MGVILGAHGVRGEAKVKSFAARSHDIAAYGPLEIGSSGRSIALEIAAKKTAKAGESGVVVVRIEGVETRDQAQALKGVELYLDRSRLPNIDEPETYYAADLVGLSAISPQGEVLGEIANVADYGAGAVLEIAGGPRGEFAVPFANAFVPEVDVPAGRVVLDLPADFFAEPERDPSGAQR